MPRGRAIRAKRGTNVREEQTEEDDDKDTDRDREQRGAVIHP